MPLTYKLTRLANSLPVLLVSDPTDDRAACGVCVGVGAHLDPPHLPGLAHLCEHMVCSSALWRHTVASYGGVYNAYTTGLQTVFHALVPTNLLHPSGSTVLAHLLGEMARALDHPALKQARLAVEIAAVDMEHSANTSRSHRAVFHGVRLATSPAHPFSRFATGNAESLRKASLRLVAAFVKRHYVASRMAVVIRGPQSVHQLAKMAAGFGVLSEGPDRLVPVPSFRFAHPLVHLPGGRSFRAVFATTPTNNTHAWVYLMGHRGAGSLLALLEQHVSLLDASTVAVSPTTTLLVLDVELTPQGSGLVAEVLAGVTAPLRFSLRLAAILSDLYSSALLDTVDPVLEDPLGEAGEWAARLQRGHSSLPLILHDTPEWNHEWGYCGGYGESNEATAWWEHAASRFARWWRATMDPGNMCCVVGGQHWQEIGGQLGTKLNTHHDQPFNTSYSVGTALPLPPATPFPVPAPSRHLQQLEPQTQLVRRLGSLETTSHLSFATRRLTHTPVRVAPNVWFRPHDTLRCAVLVSLGSARRGSATLSVCLELLAEVVCISLAHTLHDATLAGCGFRVQHPPRGGSILWISVWGFSPTTTNVAVELVDTLKLIAASPPVPSSTYHRARELLKHRYLEVEEAGLALNAASTLVVFLEPGRWTEQERAAVLETTSHQETVETLQAWSREAAVLQTLVDGGLGVEASAWGRTIQTVSRPAPTYASLSIPPGRHSHHTSLLGNGNGVCTLFQLGARSDPFARAMALFTAHVVAEWMQQQARSHRLGYGVLCGLRLMASTACLHITAATPRDVDEVGTMMEQLVAERGQQIAAMLEREFVAELVQPYLQRHTNANHLHHGPGGPENWAVDDPTDHFVSWEQLSVQGTCGGENQWWLVREVDHRAYTAWWAATVGARVLLVRVTGEESTKAAQLQAMLTAKRLPIAKNTAEEIVATTEERDLAKALWRHYRAQGQGIRFVKVMAGVAIAQMRGGAETRTKETRRAELTKQEFQKLAAESP